MSIEEHSDGEQMQLCRDRFGCLLCSRRLKQGLASSMTSYAMSSCQGEKAGRKFHCSV